MWDFFPPFNHSENISNDNETLRVYYLLMWMSLAEVPFHYSSLTLETLSLFVSFFFCSTVVLHRVDSCPYVNVLLMRSLLVFPLKGEIQLNKLKIWDILWWQFPHFSRLLIYLWCIIWYSEFNGVVDYDLTFLTLVSV